MDEPEESLEEIEYRKDCAAAVRKLADHLARRDHSVKELVQKLSKHYPNDIIDFALNEADEQNWLTPPDELAARVAEEMHRKQKGINYIRQYLRKKGLPEVAYDPDIELEKARSLLKDKFGSYNELSFEDKTKAHRYLANRGFDQQTTMRVINE